MEELTRIPMVLTSPTLRTKGPGIRVVLLLWEGSDHRCSVFVVKAVKRKRQKMG